MSSGATKFSSSKQKQNKMPSNLLYSMAKPPPFVSVMLESSPYSALLSQVQDKHGRPATAFPPYFSLSCPVRALFSCLAL